MKEDDTKIMEIFKELKDKTETTIDEHRVSW